MPAWGTYWQYAFVPSDPYYSMWNDGILWKGPYNIAAGETMPLLTEMDLISAPLRNDWSVVVHSSVSKINLTHSKGIQSDTWPV